MMTATIAHTSSGCQFDVVKNAAAKTTNAIFEIHIIDFKSQPQSLYMRAMIFRRVIVS
jgi:hypothetical protein